MTRTEMLAVLLLALATYCTRAAGLWLIGLIEMTPKRQRLLRDLSGSVLASILALAMISGDVGTWVGTLAAILV
ncbi:MAG TPA: AzlD domain-containing protein, partial [Nitrospiraceae bacterium]|nr:AzlD domain-containing protein [Nitrospiraceae bacterium]